MARRLFTAILASSCCLAANGLASVSSSSSCRSDASASSAMAIKIRASQPQTPPTPVAAAAGWENDVLLAAIEETTRQAASGGGHSDEETKADTDCANPGISPLPPVLQGIADERAEFQVNLGKAMDTLRKDLPEILKKAPDYSIYHDNINVIDPSGVQLSGLESYRSSIRFLQTFVRFWFQERPSSSGLQFRMFYDFCGSSIRVSWHVTLVPKVGLWWRRPLHIDGVSNYRLDPNSGKIIEHKFSNLVINKTPVAPPYGVLSLLQYDHGLVPAGAGIPAGV